jgi:tRNA(Phe) wybutosine-synthesizing methylase Tyw3
MFTFACGSIEGLTLAQKRETITALKASIKLEVALKRDMKLLVKEQKAEDRVVAANTRALKVQDKIEKAQMRLQKLLDKASKPVGAKAIKSNRRAGKVTIMQTEAAEANAIAAKFAAKKQIA